MRRWLTTLVLVTFALTATAFTAPGPQHLVIRKDFPDPELLDVGGTYFAYATNSGKKNIQLATSSALTGPWTQLADAMPTKHLPGWVGEDQSGMRHIWAPDVIKRDDGRFVMYYAAFHARYRHHCVGAAISDRPTGPFTSTGPEPLICGKHYDELIDPAGYVEADGQRYLLYKQIVSPIADGGKSSIRIQAVGKDGLRLIGPSIRLLQADRPGEASVIEAPTLLRRPEGYVLFYSANAFNNGRYFTNYATSKNLFGPYTKSPGTFLSRRTLDGEVLDPGGQDVSPDARKIVFHGDLARPGGPRGMYVATLGWDGLHPILGG